MVHRVVVLHAVCLRGRSRARLRADKLISPQMSEPTVKLWSSQSSDFSLTSGRVDHSKSYYFQHTEGIPEAYRRLALQFGTDQIIWCNTRYVDLKKRDIKSIEWELVVPKEAILALVDEFVWNKVFGQTGFRPPQRLIDEWQQEANEQYPYDGRARRRYTDEQRQRYRQEPAPSGDWWNHLFDAEYGEEGVCALLRHPVEPEWVISPPQ